MECVFVNSALKLQCHIVENTLLQTGFFGDFAYWDASKMITKIFLVDKGWFAMIADGSGFFGNIATLRSLPNHRTAPQCKVQFSYYDNSTKSKLYVNHIEDVSNQTIYSTVYGKDLQSSNQWKTVLVGIGSRQPGKLFLDID